MSCLFWNCRGLGNPRKVPALKKNHIDVENGEVDIWRITSVYGFPEDCNKWKTWKLLERLVLGCSILWLCVDDFNEILSDHEKLGGNLNNADRMRDFLYCLEACELFDLGFVGNKFTWSNKQAGVSNIQERLDRGLVNYHWMTKFLHVVLKHLTHLLSDHCPVLVDWNVRPTGASRHSRVKLFRFEAHWLQEDHVFDIVNRSALPQTQDVVQESCSLENRIAALLRKDDVFWFQISRMN
ncbi:hypothetical protein ACS0TY_034784 [Phlomoides rotata]